MTDAIKELIEKAEAYHENARAYLFPEYYGDDDRHELAVVERELLAAIKKVREELAKEIAISIPMNALGGSRIIRPTMVVRGNLRGK